MLIVTLIGTILSLHMDLVSVALLYLLPVLVSSVLWGRGPSFFVSIFGVLAFDYFFIPPSFGFTPTNPRDFFVLAVFLLVAFITGTMAARLRNELENTRHREHRTLALYEVSRKIAAENDLERILQTLAEKASETVFAEAIVFVKTCDSGLVRKAAACPSDNSPLEDEELGAVYWVLEHGKAKERKTQNSSEVFFPIRTADRTVGVLAVKPASSETTLTPEQAQLIEAFANLAAAAIARVKIAKEAEEAKWLAESQKLHLAAIVESSADAIVSTDMNGTIISWNSGAENMCGYTSLEAVGMNIAVLLGPQEAQKTEEIIKKMRQSCRVEHYETAVLRKDGKTIYISLTLSPIVDTPGHIIGISAIARDISESKQTEDRLRHSSEQLRALSAHLQSIREEERTNVARDIHDELGQALTGLKMDLLRLARKPPEDRKLLSNEIRSMGKPVDDIIKAVRKISRQLRPDVLDLGLLAAIEWQVEDFEKRTRIECLFSSTMEEDGDLNQDLSTVLFRILQEALTNIVRHAQATQVQVNVKRDNGYVTLVVADNGKGIREHEISDPNSLGLLGIRERAVLFGGQVEIVGSRERGTSLTVMIPAR